MCVCVCVCVCGVCLCTCVCVCVCTHTNSLAPPLSLEQHFYVERRYHGWLIGPRGSRIRDIEVLICDVCVCVGGVGWEGGRVEMRGCMDV